MEKPAMTEISLSPKMIEEVFNDFERDNPGLTHQAIQQDDFTNRLMKKIFDSARVITGGNA